MDTTLDSQYLDWLYSQIERPDDPAYFEMLDHMFKTKFDWFIPNDNNRAQDGVDLRNRFIFERSTGRPDRSWLSEDCSFLEMVIALANRLAFQIDESLPNAFWHILRNIGIDDSFCDELIDHQVLEDILYTVIWRNYEEDGSGGFFPLEDYSKDQREVELLYQMYAYVMDSNL